MLNPRVEDALNEQLKLELQSAYVYLAMAASMEAANLPGTSAWLRSQWEEELAHAMKLYSYILDRDGRVELKALDAPAGGYGTPLEVFESSLEHERTVTRAINDLYALVAEEKDFATQALLDWFTTEQVEEEKTVSQIIEDLRRVGDSGEGLYLVDRGLGESRTADTT